MQTRVRQVLGNTAPYALQIGSDLVIFDDAETAFQLLADDLPQFALLPWSE